MTVFSAVILFACSSLRHLLFQSGILDLGIYDQVAYLLSQGQPPIPSTLGFHHLGNHAAWAVYPLGLLYKIYPSPYWLFAVQAIALSSSALPVWLLAQQATLRDSQATVMAAVYLLYPLVFNVNLFDFHPEVMALPLIFTAVWAARSQRKFLFCGCLIWISGCKEVLSLTITAMGLWLLLEKRRWFGWVALAIGVSWFLISTQVIIPHFSGQEAAAVHRYAYLGNSVLEIAGNLLLKPGLVLGRLFSWGTLEYLILLFLPVVWGLSPRHLLPLVAALPTLLINLLSDSASQRDLVHQYSLPILPFLLLTAIASLSAGRNLFRQPRQILLWSLIGFLALGKYGYFSSRYLSSLDTWGATRMAIAQVRTAEPVLTTHEIGAHLAHRQVIQFTNANKPPTDLSAFKYVLLNLRHPGYESSTAFAKNLLTQLQQHPRFQPRFQKDNIYLFTRNELLVQEPPN
jgi:uncharacterized membrane protein